MSRIGKQPVTIPQGVEVAIDGSVVRVKGPKGELVQGFEDQYVTITQADGTLTAQLKEPTTPFLYNGEYGVITTLGGTLSMRARHYHPVLRRFMAQDPSGVAGGLNVFLNGRAFRQTIGLLAILCVHWRLGDLHGQNRLFELYIPQNAQGEVIQLSVTRVDGKLKVTEVARRSVGFKASGIVYHSKWDALYVTSAGRELTEFALLQRNSGRELSLEQRQRLPLSSGYTSLDRSGKYFLTVSYANGDIGVFAAGQNGVNPAPVCSISVPNKEAHCILPSLDNRFVYIPCVKLNNAIFQFEFDSASGSLSRMKPFEYRPPALFGPRHLAYHPTKPLAYFSNEQQLGVSVYSIAENGQLQDVQHAVTLPRREPYKSGKRGLHASDIVLSPDGKRLFVAVRDFVADEDSVFVFATDPDGRLRLLQRSRVGNIPWKLGVDASGKYLFVCEAGSKQLSIYAVSKTGKLETKASYRLQSAARDFALVEVE